MIIPKWILDEVFTYRAYYLVADWALAAAKDPEEIKRRAEIEMFYRLNEMVATFAMELAKEDVHYFKRNKVSDDERGTTYGAYWGPVSTTIELAGPGEHDGLLYQHQGAPFKPLLVREFPAVGVPFETHEDDEPMSIVPIERHFYMDGWDETRRVWIYRERR